jgi:hypothetical protein
VIEFFAPKFFFVRRKRMSKKFSLEHTVPSPFWNKVRSLGSNLECKADIASYHRLLLDGDIVGAKKKMDMVLRGFENEYVKSKPSCTCNYESRFNSLALRLAGRIFACTKELEIDPIYRKELAVYFGVTGAKYCLGREMSPPEFQTATMFPILLELYGDSPLRPTLPRALDSVADPLPNTEQPIRRVKSKLRLPRAMIKDLKKSSMSWSRAPGGYWVNFERHFHTATKEWDEFRQYILSSPFRNESPRMLIARTGSSYPDDSPPLDKTGLPPRDQYASVRIARSQFCSKVWFCDVGVICARIGPLSHALPYLIRMFTDPPEELNEARYPKGAYVRTIDLWFKDWCIQIDVFRN